MIEAKVYLDMFEMFQGPIDYKEQSILNHFERFKNFFFNFVSKYSLFLRKYFLSFCNTTCCGIQNTAYTDSWAT